MIARVNWGGVAVGLGYRIDDRTDGSTVVARTTSGVSRVGATFLYQVDTPYARWPYSIIWDAGGEYASEDFVAEGPADMVSLGGAAVDDGTAELALKSLSVVNDSGSALYLEGSGDGLDIELGSGVSDLASASMLAAVLAVVQNILRWFTNRMRVLGGTLILYGDDAVTPLYTQTVSEDGADGERSSAS